MVPNDTMHPVLPKTRARGRALAMLVVTASLLGASAGYVHAAVPGPRSSELRSPNNDRAKPEEHNVRLAAAPVPKVSVPQVHVNVGTHLQSPKISTPQIHANVGTHVNTSNVHSTIGVRSAHQLDKDNGSKGKGGNIKGGNANSGGLSQPINGESQDTGHRNSITIESW